MGKKLAIKGHITRGKEVIELLEMLGGNNKTFALKGFDVNTYYYIDRDGDIINCYTNDLERDTFMCLTLNEFYEKYPFKVGDKVFLYDNITEGCVTGMEWDKIKGTVKYCVYTSSECWCDVKDLLKWNTIDLVEKHNEEHCDYMQMGKTVAVIFNDANYEDEVELQLGDYEIEVRDGKTYAVKKKPVYPKTYAECCEVLMGKTNFSEFSLVPIKYSNTTKFDNEVSPDAPHIELFNNLYKIFICRNAYWKIAGEEMNLGKPWKPDWTNYDEYKHCLYITENVITKGTFYNDNQILSFPTAEMRNAFYENFKNEIEQCKELL